MKIRASLRVALLAAVAALAACAPAPMPGRWAIESQCTSFCLDNGGNAIFGTNFDNEIWEGMVFVNKRGVTKTGWEAGTSGKYARWTAQYGSLTFNLAGVQMAWAGMNEAGLMVSTMGLTETSDPTPDERPPLMMPLWVQYQLDTCATIEEVMANDSRVRITGAGDHYLICDRSGACTAVEFLDGRTVFHAGDDLPVKALTNHPYRQAVADWQRSQRSDHHSRKRFAVAADRVTAFEAGDSASAVDYAFGTLYQASGRFAGSSTTQWSIVFDPQNLRAHFRTDRNTEVRTVDLSRLEFGCATPAQMLDVHAPLGGDITGYLEPFNFEANLLATKSFLQKWGAGISPLEMEILERGLESFACKNPVVPYQEERELMLSPVVGWAVRAVLHRYWHVGAALVLAIAVLIVWRVRVGRRGRQKIQQGQ